MHLVKLLNVPPCPDHVLGHDLGRVLRVCARVPWHPAGPPSGSPVVALVRSCACALARVPTQTICPALADFLMSFLSLTSCCSSLTRSRSSSRMDRCSVRWCSRMISCGVLELPNSHDIVSARRARRAQCRTVCIKAQITANISNQPLPETDHAGAIAAVARPARRFLPRPRLSATVAACAHPLRPAHAPNPTPSYTAPHGPRHIPTPTRPRRSDCRFRQTRPTLPSPSSPKPPPPRSPRTLLVLTATSLGSGDPHHRLVPREQSFFFLRSTTRVLRISLAVRARRSPRPLCLRVFRGVFRLPPCARAPERANAVGSSALARAVAEIAPFALLSPATAAGRPVCVRLPSLPPLSSSLPPFLPPFLPHFISPLSPSLHSPLRFPRSSRSPRSFRSRARLAAMSRLPAVVIDNGTGYVPLRLRPPARRSAGKAERMRARTEAHYAGAASAHTFYAFYDGRERTVRDRFLEHFLRNLRCASAAPSLSVFLFLFVRERERSVRDRFLAHFLRNLCCARAPSFSLSLSLRARTKARCAGRLPRKLSTQSTLRLHAFLFSLLFFLFARSLVASPSLSLEARFGSRALSATRFVTLRPKRPAPNPPLFLRNLPLPPLFLRNLPLTPLFLRILAYPFVLVCFFIRYTKMGYAGNDEPQFIIPTVIGTKDERSSGTGTIKAKKGIEDLDFYIGDEAVAQSVRLHSTIWRTRTGRACLSNSQNTPFPAFFPALVPALVLVSASAFARAVARAPPPFFPLPSFVQNTYNVTYPIRKGQIDDWDLMEKFWEQSIFKYMRCEPEDHYFFLVRSPRSTRPRPPASARPAPTRPPARLRSTYPRPPPARPALIPALACDFTTDRAAAERAGEPRVHRGDHVRDLQRARPLHRRPGPFPPPPSLLALSCRFF